LAYDRTYLQKFLRLQVRNIASSWESLAGAQKIIFPKTGCGLGHVTPKIFDVIEKSSKLLELNTVRQFLNLLIKQQILNI